jgi:S-adenosyl methyltransferase
VCSAANRDAGIHYDQLVADREVPMSAFDVSRPNIARVYDYLLGGKDNFAADRGVGEQIMASLPAVQVGVRAQRALLGRVVRYLVEEAGIRQLIDIGSGLPTADNVHEIAQRINPPTRVVYVDNDPVVLSHARALLADNTATIVVDGDLRHPAGILQNPDVLAHLDWDRPVGLLLCGILHHLLDEEHPTEVMAGLCRSIPAGSYVFIHHLLDCGDPAVADVQAALQQGLGRGQFRTRAQIRDLFTGLELVEPGLVLVPDWRPDAGTPTVSDFPALQLACAGVARKL